MKHLTLPNRLKTVGNSKSIEWYDFTDTSTATDLSTSPPNAPSKISTPAHSIKVDTVTSSTKKLKTYGTAHFIKRHTAALPKKHSPITLPMAPSRTSIPNPSIEKDISTVAASSMLTAPALVPSMELSMASTASAAKPSTTFATEPSMTSTTEPSTTSTNEPSTTSTNEPSTTEPSPTPSSTTGTPANEPSTSQSYTTERSMLDQISKLTQDNLQLLNHYKSYKRDADVATKHLLQLVNNSRKSEKKMKEYVYYLYDEISSQNKELKDLQEIIKIYEDEHDKRMTSNYKILENGSIGIIDKHSQQLLYSTYDASFHLEDIESIPDLPNTGYCKWTYDEKTRVLLAKFEEQIINAEDENFLLQMMERDDVTVVSEGLVSPLDEKLWDLKYLDDRIIPNIDQKYTPTKTMTLQRLIPDLSDHMDQVDEPDLSDHMDQVDEPTKTMTIKTHGRTDIYYVPAVDNKERPVLYSSNINLDKLLPETKNDFVNNFKLPGLFIGGSNCMLNMVRSDMYLYLVTYN